MLCLRLLQRARHNYRKTHLWGPDGGHEKSIFTPGNELAVVDFPILRTGESVKVGILICFDSEFPEPARVLAVKGAHLILIATGLILRMLSRRSSGNIDKLS
jgi:predicted amidohydrolase